MIAIPRVGLFAISALFLFLQFGDTPTEAQNKAEKHATYPKQILIIRHGEKVDEITDIHISKQGQERADSLERLFITSKERPDPFPKPDFIFAARNSKASHRPLETVTPLAKKLKLPINDSFDSKLPLPPDPAAPKSKAETVTGITELRDKLFGDSKYAGKTILVCWRHGSIVELAKALKADKIPEKWADEVFDRVWTISYDAKGKATFCDRPQWLLAKDSEK